MYVCMYKNNKINIFVLLYIPIKYFEIQNSKKTDKNAKIKPLKTRKKLVEKPTNKLIII